MVYQTRRGPLVKRLRHRPLTPITGVRFPHGSPKWFPVYTGIEPQRESRKLVVSGDPIEMTAGGARRLQVPPRVTKMISGLHGNRTPKGKQEACCFRRSHRDDRRRRASTASPPTGHQNDFRFTRESNPKGKAGSLPLPAIPSR